MVGFGLVNIFGREIVKAESIEQIREHLEKGGRVIDSDDREVFTKCNWPWLVKDLTSEELANWTLLPLEEKEPETVASDKIEAAGRLVKFIREYSSGQCRILSIGSACECPLCDVGRLLEEKEPVDHGTQKGQDIKAELAKRGMEAPLMSLWLSTHIRQKLLFGQVPTMDELLQWWEDTSGERIEHGKRCERCQCSGKIKRDAGSSYKDVPCDDCQGSGYSVRPTWMEERK